MSKRPNAHDHIQPALAAQAYEMARVSVSTPIKLSGRRFMIVPEEICGDQIDARSFDLEQFFLPIFRWKTGEMKFTAYAKPGMALARQIIIGKPNLVSKRIDPTQAQMT